MIKKGSNDIAKMYLGSNEIGKVYLGNNLVFQNGGTPTPSLVLYDWLVFDGTAYIDAADILLPTNGSIRVESGFETQKVEQHLFSNGRTYVLMNSDTSSSKRYFTVGYDSTSPVLNGTQKGLEFTYTSYGLILTPKRYGFGGSTVTFTKGSSPASIGFCFGSSAGHSGQSFTGRFGTLTIYDSSAQEVTSYAGLDSYTPIYTLKPCTYENEAGFWCVETSTFYGNTAGAGNLSVINNS